MFHYVILTAIGASFFTSCLVIHRNTGWHLKLFAALLGVTCMVEWFAIFGVHVFRLGTNVPLYNCFMLEEFWVYALYYKNILKSNRIKKVNAFFLIAFPLFWILSTCLIFGLRTWNSYVLLAGGFFAVVFSAVYYFQAFTAEPPIDLRKNTEFWIATGMILFYTVNIPYLGILSYLVKNHPKLAEEMLLLLGYLSIAMYLLFTYAFLCQIRTRKYGS